MKKFSIFLSLAVFILLGFHSCVEEPEYPGSICGDVIDVYTGTPLDNVEVLIMPKDEKVYTNKKGEYTILGVEKGNYVLTFTKNGYVLKTEDVIVQSGIQSTKHAQIEKLPLCFQTDHDTLDYGEKEEFLSFSILNPNYQDVEWNIQSTTPWIEEVSPKSGKLGYNKQESILVKIIRKRLPKGPNSADLQVHTVHGNTTILVKAYGNEVIQPTIEMLPIKQINMTTVLLQATIDTVGFPGYQQSGFVYSKEPNVDLDHTIDNLIVDQIEDAKIQYELDGLSAGVDYYVKAYIVSSQGIFYSEEELIFNTSKDLPKVTIQKETDVNFEKQLLTLNGTLEAKGNPACTECGFVWNTEGDPTILSSKLLAESNLVGPFKATLANLPLNTTLYVRAYAVNERGVNYSENTLEISTQLTAPELSILPVKDVDLASKSAVLVGTISNVGNPPYHQRGFVYSESENPTIENLKIVCDFTGDAPAGEFQVKMHDFALGKEYYIRAYAMYSDQVAYSQEAVILKTDPSLPMVQMLEVTQVDLTQRSAHLRAEVTNDGSPAYVERGFVYATNPQPTLETTLQKVVIGKDENKLYKATLYELDLDTHYYVRAYLASSVKTIYSENELDFVTEVQVPEVTIEEVASVDIVNGTAVLDGRIIQNGNPSYTERGFVWSTHEQPTLEDKKVLVSVNEEPNFQATITDLPLNAVFYVRSYAVGAKGIVYSDKEVSFSTQAQLPTLTVQPATQVDLVQKSVLLHGQIQTVGSPAYTQRGFVMGETESPTINDQKIICDFSGESAIGDFQSKVFDLSIGATYFVRAYAIAGEEVVYSAESISFTMQETQPTVTTQKVTGVDLKSLSASFHAQIQELGNPACVARGFVFATTPGVTLENTIQKVSVAMNSELSYEAVVRGLSLNEHYYVRAYVITPNGTIYATNEEEFETTVEAPNLVLLDISSIDLTHRTVQLNARLDKAGNPSYYERGFVYAKHNLPTLEDTRLAVLFDESSQEGDFSAQVQDIVLNETYYVRAYCIYKEGCVYSETTIHFQLNAQAPQVKTLPVSDLDYVHSTVVLNAAMIEAGNPPYSARGFVYSDLPNPSLESAQSQVITVTTTDFSSKILVPTGKTLYVKAYAQNQAGVVYGEEVQVCLISELPLLVSRPEITALDPAANRMSVSASIDKEGIPAYTERGFVWGPSSLPTIDNDKITDYNTGTGKFQMEAYQLPINEVYYLRAYARSEFGVSYSPEVKTSLYTVGMVRAERYDNLSFDVYSEYTQEGYPAYMERGFVYSTDESMPALGNATKKVCDSPTEFKVNLYPLEKDVTYYVRSYTINSVGVSYSSNVATFKLGDYLEYPQQSLAVQIKDGTAGTPAEVESDCVNSTLGGYTDWRVPTAAEFDFMRNQQIDLQLQEGVSYWNKIAYDFVLNDVQNRQPNSTPSYEESHAIRCVRTITSDGSSADIKEQPVVLTGGVTTNNLSYAIYSATIKNPGVPRYAERGFVVHHFPNTAPTIEDNFAKLVVKGSDAEYSVTHDHLANMVSPQGLAVYYRAYVKTLDGTVYYGEVKSFILTYIKP